MPNLFILKEFNVGNNKNEEKREMKNYKIKKAPVWMI